MLASPPEDIPSVFDSISIDFRSFVRSVRRYSQSKFANFDVPSSISSLAPPIFFNSYCLECGKTFASYQRLAVHRKVQHGIRDPVDLLVGTVHCTVCMSFFIIVFVFLIMSNIGRRSVVLTLNLLGL